MASNWQGMSPPVAGDDLVFPTGVANTDATNDFPPNTLFNSITIQGNGALSSRYHLLGASIVLGSGGLSDSNITVPGGLLLGDTVSLGIQLNASQTWTNSSSATLILDGANIDLNNSTLTLDSADGVGSIFSVISGNGAGSVAIAKTGGGPGVQGDWSLLSSNTFSGQVVVSLGRLFIGDNNALGVADNTPANGTIVNAGGTIAFAVDGIHVGTEALSLRGTGNANKGVVQSAFAAIWDGRIDVDSSVAMVIGGVITLNGLITDATASGQLGVGGAGQVIVSDVANNFTGNTVWGVVGSGTTTLSVATTDALPTTVSPTISPGGTLELFNGVQQSLVSINGSGAVRLGGAAGGTLTITNANGVYSGSVSTPGTGAIVMSNGTTTWTGTSTFNGSFTNNGAIFDLSIGTLPATYVQSAGLLGLSSNATIGDVTIDAGTIFPGHLGTGDANTKNLVLTGGQSTIYAELINGSAAGQFGRLHVTGTVHLGGATLSLSGTASGVVAGNQFVLIDNNQSEAVVGNFAGLAEGATIASGPGGINYRISYTGGDGNDVVLVALGTTPVRLQSFEVE